MTFSSVILASPRDSSVTGARLMIAASSWRALRRSAIVAGRGQVGRDDKRIVGIGHFVEAGNLAGEAGAAVAWAGPGHRTGRGCGRRRSHREPRRRARSVPSCTRRVAKTPSSSVRFASRHVPAGGLVRVGLEFLQLGHEVDGVEQLVDAGALDGGGLHEGGVAAMLSGRTPEAVELLLGLAQVGVGHVDLVEATTMETPAALAWLMASSVCRHDAVVHATTDDGDSVTLAPRARILVKPRAGYRGR